LIETTRSGHAFVLKMVAGENRFNPTMLDAFRVALDEVEAASEPVAVVVTGEGKYFSNGLDLEWMAANADQGGPAAVANGMQQLYARLLTFPSGVVAAINGHAFAGGGMLALACDMRVMREDRGYFCLPEVDINIPFSLGMARLIQAKLTAKTAHEAMLTGRRYGGPAALHAGIVDAVAGEQDVLSVALERANELAPKSRATYGAIKRTVYSEAMAALAEAIEL